MNRVQWTPRAALIAVLIIAALSAPWWLPNYYVQLSTRSLFLGLTAMSFILLAGYAGMVSLAQMSFFAMSGYIIGIGVLDHGWPFIVAMPLAFLGAVLLSAAFGLVAIRAKGIYFLMMTLALSQLAYGVALQWANVTHGWDGVSGVPRPVIFGWSLLDTVPLYFLTLAVTALSYLILRRLVRSQFGLALQGIRDNPARMAALGYDVQYHRFLVIVISGAFAGIAGILGVFFYGGVSPETTGLSQIMLVIMAAIVGGTALLEGGVVGAFITVLLLSFASQYTQRYLTIVGLVFILVILFLPQGVLGGRRKGKGFPIALGGLGSRWRREGKVSPQEVVPAEGRELTTGAVRPPGISKST